jgi:hypothetical protein
MIPILYAGNTGLNRNKTYLKVEITILLKKNSDN